MDVVTSTYMGSNELTSYLNYRYEYIIFFVYLGLICIPDTDTA